MIKTEYEWRILTLSEHAYSDGKREILDHNCAWVLSKEFLQNLQNPNTRLYLVRTAVYKTCSFKSWAYVDTKEGTLPEHFTNEDGNLETTVPKMFHNELRSFYPRH